MRGGICSIQLQALTPEAATVVKNALNLATRRGHAQVTPLHVASAMLATSTGLLRKACLQCHSHPLQCKALELCFNVALNRLPASTPSPLLGPNHHLNQYSTTPSLSNALVAAFKRAQAHQRRGSIENQQQQQQHILALKIEVEQLIISILDDPSVSRVMREAGFSSTLVKTRVEQTVSIEVCSQKGTDRSQSKDNNTTRPNQVLNGGGGGCSNVSPSRPFGQFVISPHSSLIKHVDHHHHHANIDDDVTSVLNELVKRRRNAVIVGESLANAEGVARGVMERFEVGNVPGELRYVQFVSLPLVYFRNIGKDEVEQKIMEVRSLVKSYVGRGVILYLGDLKWLFEFWSNYCEQRTNYYCSVEHMVMEIKKLVSGSVENSSSNNNRLWLMGIANFKTYMKCKISHPSLETIWELHPFTIPVGSLSLSLNFDSDFQAQDRSKVLFKDLSFEDRSGVRKNLTCCRDCSLNFEKEAQNITNSVSKKVCTATSLLPAWLQNCKEEKSHIMENDEENARLKDLCKKWNSFCNSVHRHKHISILEKPVLFGSSSSPSSPNSVSSSHETKTKLHHHHSLINWPIISSGPEENVPTKECELLYTDENNNNDDDDDCYDGNLIMFMPDHNRNLPKPDLLSNPNSSPNSASSSEAVEGLDSTEMFTEVNAENLKILCDALERKVPQNKHNIPEIASTILHCRSGMRKKGEKQNKQETWMVFSGENSESKESISREIAKVVFGSYNNFVTIGMSKYDSNHEESKSKKRARDEFGSSYLQRFWEAANENPHRVFFMEDLDQIDNFSRKGLKEAIESGSVTLPSCGSGESIPLKDAIVIFSCESRFISSSVPRSSPQTARMSLSDNEDNNKGKENIVDNDDDNLEEKSSSLCLDLNIAAIEDDNNAILELVDKQINFNIQKLL